MEVLLQNTTNRGITANRGIQRVQGYNGIYRTVMYAVHRPLFSSILLFPVPLYLAIPVSLYPCVPCVLLDSPHRQQMIWEATFTVSSFKEKFYVDVEYSSDACVGVHGSARESFGTVASTNFFP